LISKIGGLIAYAIAVSLGVITVLMLMSPGDFPQESQHLPDAPALIERLVSASRYNPAVASQQAINAFLSTSRHAAWIPPLASIPTPEWAGERVLLGTNGVTYSFVLTLWNYPLHFSETFRLAGAPGKWVLVAESGSIGLLSVKSPFLAPLSLLASASLSPHARLLNILSGALTMEIRYGNVVFTTR
jgi:hypothetical protein